MNISQHLETFPGFSSAIAPASRPDAWASQEFEPIYDMLSRLWSNAGRLGKWASAHDLDNTLLARLKSYSAIMEVIPHPESFRYKAVGDDIAKHSPFDLAGKDSWEMVTQGWSLAAYRAHHSEMFALFANAYRQKRLVSLSGSVDAYGTLLIDAAAAPFTTNGLWPDVIFAVMMIRPITRN